MSNPLEVPLAEQPGSGTPAQFDVQAAIYALAGKVAQNQNRAADLHRWIQELYGALNCNTADIKLQFTEELNTRISQAVEQGLANRQSPRALLDDVTKEARPPRAMSCPWGQSSQSSSPFSGMQQTYAGSQVQGLMDMLNAQTGIS